MIFNSNFLLNIYGVGIIIAFILACVEYYLENKRGENVDEFDTMICPLALLSWVYVYVFVKRIIFKK